MTEDFIEYLTEGAVGIEVFGHRQADPGRNPALWDLSIIQAKTRTLRDRLARNQTPPQICPTLLNAFSQKPCTKTYPLISSCLFCCTCDSHGDLNCTGWPLWPPGGARSRASWRCGYKYWSWMRMGSTCLWRWCQHEMFGQVASSSSSRSALLPTQGLLLYIRPP